MRTPQDRQRTALARRVELWPVERLRPYIRALEGCEHHAALAHGAVGLHVPILLYRQRGIVAGEQRFWEALAAGVREVPVVVLDGLSQAEQRAYIAADQKLRAETNSGCRLRKWRVVKSRRKGCEGYFVQGGEYKRGNKGEEFKVGREFRYPTHEAAKARSPSRHPRRRQPNPPEEAGCSQPKRGAGVVSRRSDPHRWERK